MVVIRNNLGGFPAKEDLIVQKDQPHSWLRWHRSDVLLRAIRFLLGNAVTLVLAGPEPYSRAQVLPKLKASVSRQHANCVADRPAFDPGFSTTLSALSLIHI